MRNDREQEYSNRNKAACSREQADQCAWRQDPQEDTKGSNTRERSGVMMGQQNESILTTAPQNLAQCERLVNIY